MTPNTRHCTTGWARLVSRGWPYVDALAVGYRREVIDKQVRLMHERGIWARPDNGAGASGG
jgi:hypothetical protein